jgi:type I restriction enzyme S subunit
MGEIDTVLLGDIAEITAGQSPPGFTINRSGDGVPFFQGAKDFGARYPQVRTYTTAPARLASPGDILLSVRAPIGRVNRCQAKCAIGRGVSALRSRSEIALTDYLEYWLRAYEPRWYQHESAGSVFSNLSTTELLHLELSLPPLSEQRAIAEVLGALDDKIEANRRLSNLCDALWQTMAAEVFDDIEDGVITSGDLQPLSSIATFVNGKAFTKDATGTGRMVVRIAELNSGPGASTIYNEIEVPAEHIAAPGDLLLKEKK